MVTGRVAMRCAREERTARGWKRSRIVEFKLVAGARKATMVEVWCWGGIELDWMEGLIVGEMIAGA